MEVHEVRTFRDPYIYGFVLAGLSRSHPPKGNPQGTHRAHLSLIHVVAQRQVSHRRQSTVIYSLFLFLSPTLPIVVVSTTHHLSIERVAATVAATVTVQVSSSIFPGGWGPLGKHPGPIAGPAVAITGVVPRPASSVPLVGLIGAAVSHR